MQPRSALRLHYTQICEEGHSCSHSDLTNAILPQAPSRPNPRP